MYIYLWNRLYIAGSDFPNNQSWTPKASIIPEEEEDTVGTLPIGNASVVKAAASWNSSPSCWV